MNRFFLLISLNLISVLALSQSVEQRILKKFGKQPVVSHSKQQPVGCFVVKSQKSVINRNLRENKLQFAIELSPGYYVITLDGSVPEQVEVLAPANDQWKLAPEISDKSIPSGSVYVISTTDLDAFKLFLKERSVLFQLIDEHRPSGTISIKIMRESDFGVIVQCPFVVFMDVSKQPVAETPNSLQDISVNAVNVVHHQFPELNGDGLAVSVKERALDRTDIDLKGRLTSSPLEDAEISLHANLMATIIAGAGNSVPSSKGVAWASRISSSSFSRLLPDDKTALQDLGIFLQNHSYGTAIENYYGAEAHAYDVQTTDDPVMVHVFSSGNAGGETPSWGLYSGIPGYANLTGNMKMAKNVLVAGGHYADGQIDSRNSRGPAYDGRLKPDLIAFGPEGTSDGAAMVSGISLLLQYAYENIHGSLPSSALVKAVLIATADDAGREGIDFTSGYGAANAVRAIEAVQQGHFFSGEVQTGIEKDFSFSVPAGIGRLRIAMVWNDPAASAGADKALVNDLDLALAHNGTGEQWLPWVLSHFPHADSLSALPKRKRDRLNNAELITVEDPPEGEYTIRVKANELATSAQTFHIAYRVDSADRFRWTYPTASDKLETGKEVYMRWENSYPGTGSLEVSVNGSAFQLVASAIDLSKRFLAWVTPDTTTIAVLRMKTGSAYHVSDTFTISPVPEIQVGYDCDAEILLQWNRIDNADGYAVYAIGERYLEKISTISDTAIFLAKDNGLPRHFAVAPVMGTTTGLISASYDYTVQGVQCYYRTFLASNVDDSHARLLLELGTYYNVEKVVFEKEVGDEFVSIGEIPAGTELHYVHLDPLSEGGVYRYRAKIVLVDGDVIVTDVAVLYFSNEETFILFPNPVNAGAEELQVLSAADEFSLAFYDTTGKLVKTQPLVGPLFRFPVYDLISGLYLYRVFRGTEPVASGKLVVR